MLIGCFLWQITSAHFDEVGLWWCWEWSTVEQPDPHQFPLNHSKKERGTQPMTNERLGLGLAWLEPWWGHSPKQRLICRYRMPPHALHTPYNLLPHAPHRRHPSPGNCNALWEQKSSGCVVEKTHVTHVVHVTRCIYVYIVFLFFMRLDTFSVLCFAFAFTAFFTFQA